MQTSGNFLLILSFLAVAYLFKLTFLQKMPGGDYGVGYSWAIFFSMGIFWLCMALVACIIGFGGGFAWLSLGKFSGAGPLVLGFLVMLLGSNLGMEASFRGIKFLAPVIAVVTPLVLMTTFAVLLNENLKTNMSPTYIKCGLAVVLALNILMLGAIIFGSLASKFGAFLPRNSDTLDNFQLGILNQIDNCDASKDITSLFIFSGDNQPQQIREKARLKIKSKPDWQEDLYNLMDGNAVDEGFLFLIYNEVDDKPRFAKGVYQGVLSQARLIRESLRRTSHPSHVYDGKYRFEVERSLKVVEKFKDLGVDFTPAVKELRAALDEPIPFENPNLSCKKLLDKWLKQHSK